MHTTVTYIYCAYYCYVYILCILLLRIILSILLLRIYIVHTTVTYNIVHTTVTYKIVHTTVTYNIVHTTVTYKIVHTTVTYNSVHTTVTYNIVHTTVTYIYIEYVIRIIFLLMQVTAHIFFSDVCVRASPWLFLRNWLKGARRLNSPLMHGGQLVYKFNYTNGHMFKSHCSLY